MELKGATKRVLIVKYRNAGLNCTGGGSAKA